jgi:hypothetical protein
MGQQASWVPRSHGVVERHSGLPQHCPDLSRVGPGSPVPWCPLGPSAHSSTYTLLTAPQLSISYQCMGQIGDI